MPHPLIVNKHSNEVAFVVCHAVGLNTNSANSDYIQLYNGDKKDTRRIVGTNTEGSFRDFRGGHDRQGFCV